MRNKILTIIQFVLLLYPPGVFSQTLSYLEYSSKDGLPSNVITEIFQDKKGYIWIGTNNGLCVYDGVEFKKYSTVDGLSNNWITSIAEDRSENGTLWIGTIAGGINKFKDGIFKTYSFGANTDSNNVSNIVVDNKGEPWFTSLFGFWRIENDSILKINDQLAPQNPSLIICDNNRNIWCAEKNIVYVYDLKNKFWQTAELKLSKSDTIVSLLCDSDGKIWAGTSNNLILQFSLEGILQRGTCKYGTPYKMQDDGYGTLYIRSHDIFFTVSKKDLTSQRILSIEKNKEMPYDITSPFIFDRENNIWIATWLRGLWKISEPAIYHIPFSDSLEINYPIEMNAALFDNNGNLWIGGIGGVWIFYLDKNSQWQNHFYSFPVLKNKAVYVSYVDSNNRIWLRIEGLGIFYLKTDANNSGRIHPGNISITGINDKTLKNNVVLALTVDDKNRLWYSVPSTGISLYDLQENRLLELYSIKDRFSGDPATRVLFHDRKNQLWIGSWLDGIEVYSDTGDVNTEEFLILREKLSSQNGLSGNLIRSIYEDNNGDIWIGTRHSGVNLLRDGKIFTVSMINGLKSNSVWTINAGPNGKIFLGTDVGIEQIDSRTLEIIPSKLELLVGQCVSISSFQFKSFKNKLWCFYTSEGIIIYEDDENKKFNPPPDIDIKKILVNGAFVSKNDLSHLSYNQNNITVEFTGLTFKDAELVRYQYRLVGAHDNWIPIANQHAVNLASISPGSYTFEISAIDNDGLTSEIPASFSFVISPPFWQQWGFILLIGILLSGIIYLVFRSRIKRLLELEKLRLRIASDLHDDVGTNLSSILLSSQIMERKFALDNSEKEYLGQLRLTASKTQELLREIVWLINPSNDSSENLILRLKSISAEILQGIKYSFHSDENFFPEKLSIEFKRNVVLIFKESLQNIIKHSFATNVIIELKRDKNIGFIEISDNGKGFDINNNQKGNGLVNLYSRADAINGKLKIESIEGSGTTISLSFNTTQTRTVKKGIFKIN